MRRTRRKPASPPASRQERADCDDVRERYRVQEKAHPPLRDRQARAEVGEESDADDDVDQRDEGGASGEGGGDDECDRREIEHQERVTDAMRCARVAITEFPELPLLTRNLIAMSFPVQRRGDLIGKSRGGDLAAANFFGNL